MGGSQSKTEIKQLSEQLNEVSSQTVQNCEVAISQDQAVKEVNTGIWLWSEVKLEQTSEIKSECFSSVEKQNELQNNLINKISQTASVSGVALLDAFSAAGTTASANLTNIIRNKITMSNIQNSYNAIKQKQSVDFANSGLMVYRSVDLTQGSKIFAAATLNELNKAGIFTTIETYLDQKTSTKLENPLDFLTNLVGGITSGITTSMLTVVGIFFVLILSPFILIAIVSRLGGSGSPERVYIESGPGMIPDTVPTAVPNAIPDEQPALNQTSQSASDTMSQIPDVMPVSTTPIQQPQQPSLVSTPRPVSQTSAQTMTTAVETASTAINLLNSLSKKQVPVTANTTA